MTERVKVKRQKKFNESLGKGGKIDNSKNNDDLDDVIAKQLELDKRTRRYPLRINGVDFHHDVFTIHKGWYKQARRNNMSVNAWTVNKEKDMEKMIQMGVDMLTTDNPLEARGLMEKSDVMELK